MKILKSALFAASVLLSPLTAIAAMPMADSKMDDMTAAPGAPVDYGFGPGMGKHGPSAPVRLRIGAGGRRVSSSNYAFGTVPVGGASAGVGGYFDPPVPWPINGLHELLLSDGRVVNYGTNQLGQQGAQLWYDVWTPSLGTGANAHTLLPNTTTTDIFCSMQSLLWGSGNVLITGGDLTISGKRNYSNNNTNIFNPQTNTLSSIGPMQYPRWYPSIVGMPNGEMLTLGGRLAPASPALTPEVYNPSTGWRTLTGIALPNSNLAFGNYYADWFYPKGFVAPSGKVFLVGPDGRMWNMVTTGAGSLARIPGAVPYGSNELSTVMYAPGKLLSLRLNSATELIDINGVQPVLTAGAPIDQVRYWSTATVLADGTVAVTGGSSVANQLINVDYTTEIWNPATGQWTAGATATKPRLYHSIALLLPDATVLTGAGGAPGPVNELNAEIYYPPYLYLNDGSGNPAPRPTLVSAPATATIGQTVTATVGPTDVISRVTFVRTGSMTHSTNIDQRFIEASFTQSGNVITATLPSNPNVMTPGYYMMFVLANGVPSVSQIMLVNTAS